MPVNVYIPTHIRVDPDALMTRQADIEDVLFAALVRALENSRRTVLEKRGGYMGVTLHPPKITWIGDGLGDISQALYEEMEACVKNVIVQAVKTAGISHLAKAGKERTEPLIDDVAEPIDYDRFYPLLDLYLVPSYKQGGKLQALTFEPFEITVPRDSSSIVEQYVWPIIHNHEDFIAAVETASYLGRTSYPAGGFPDTGYFGAIYQHNDGRKWVYISRFPGDELIIEGSLTDDLYSYKLDTKTGEVVRTRVAFTPDSSYRLRWFSDASNPTEVYRKFFTPYIEKQIRDQSAIIGKISTAEFENALAQKIEKVLATIKPSSPSKGCFIVLTMDSGEYLIGISAPLPSNVNIELLPLVKLERVQRKKGKESKDGDRGQTGDAGKLGQKSGKDAGQGEDEGSGAQEQTGQEGVYTGEKGESKTGKRFPSVSYGSTAVQECVAFLDEPTLEVLGEDGKVLQQLMEEIARKLEMELPVCAYAGQFCLNAAATLGSHALAIGEYSVQEKDEGFIEPIKSGSMNLGLFQFVPTASHALQLLRILAGVTPLLRKLSLTIDQIYKNHEDKIGGIYTNSSVGWSLHLHIELSSQMKESVGYIFATTCRILLLQLLRSSYKEIMKRKNNFQHYLPYLEILVQRRLLTLDELLQLHDHLTAEIANTHVGTAFGHAIYSTWHEAHRGVTAALAGQHPLQSVARGPKGFVMRKGDVIVGILDSQSKLWTKQELDDAIATRRGEAEDIDPVLKQLIDTEGFIQRAKNDNTIIGKELEKLLEKMRQSNEDITAKVINSWKYAFQASKIQEDISSSSVGGYALQGIHLLAHQQISEFFLSDSYYDDGIKALFGAQQGFEGLTEFFLFTGVILLAVICPPLGIIAGAGLAVYQYEKAEEREEIYRSLIDPELVLSSAEVEQEFFAAELGLALAFIPEVGTILRGSSVAVRAIARQGLRSGAKVFTRYVRIGITKEIAEQLKHGVIYAFVKDLAIGKGGEKVFQQIMEPIMDQLERDITTLGPVGGSEGAKRLLQSLADKEQAASEQ